MRYRFKVKKGHAKTAAVIFTSQWLSADNIDAVIPIKDDWLQNHPEYGAYHVTWENKPEGGKRGKPVGIPSPSTYGCKTVVKRIPEKYADKITLIINNYENLEAILEDWQDRINEAAKTSKSGKPSPRYDQLINFLDELKQIYSE